MPEKSYTFIEKTDSDNGYDFFSGVFTTGEREAESIKDLVDQVVSDLGPGDCIKSLTIVGHGAPGYISIGNGQDGGDVTKGIDGNENVWGPEFDRLRCRFCPGGVVYLRGCNVGAEAEGARKLFRIARRLQCAIVQAPTGVCNPLYTTGEDQTVRPGDERPPKALPNPDAKDKKKKKGTGERVSLVGGNVEEPLSFEARQINAARYLPRVLGLPFSLELAEEAAEATPKALLAPLRQGLANAAPQWLPSHGFALDGYLQLRIRRGGQDTWVAPGALIGGLAYYSPFREDTTIAYVIPPALRAKLRPFHRKAVETRRAREG